MSYFFLNGYQAKALYAASSSDSTRPLFTKVHICPDPSKPGDYVAEAVDGHVFFRTKIKYCVGADEKRPAIDMRLLVPRGALKIGITEQVRVYWKTFEVKIVDRHGEVKFIYGEMAKEAGAGEFVTLHEGMWPDENADNILPVAFTTKVLKQLAVMTQGPVGLSATTFYLEIPNPLDQDKYVLRPIKIKKGGDYPFEGLIMPASIMAPSSGD